MIRPIFVGHVTPAVTLKPPREATTCHAEGSSAGHSSSVVVLGGGAAGLLAAITAGRRGRQVKVLERNSDIGQKIRISGGGRCNFTNVSESLRHAFHSSDVGDSSSSEPFFQKAFQRYPPEKFVALVESHGVKYHEKKLGQLFCDRSAEDIVELLREECKAADVEICTNCQVTALTSRAEASNGARFFVSYERLKPSGSRPRPQIEVLGEESVEAEAVIVASGGLSFARTCGATDLAHQIASSFGLEVRGIRPGLVPLLLPAEDAWTRQLLGLSLEVKASIGGGAAFVEKMLFTHKGISGPAVLQASSFWGPGSSGGLAPLFVDLLPQLSEADVLQWLSTAKGPASQELSKKLPKRFARTFWEHKASPMLGVAESCRIEDLPAESLQRLVQLLKQWEVPIAGTEGYPKAEVTCGGVASHELSDETMESLTNPGLYFVGEAVDVTGWLGGYNFQWAWASGYAAGSVC